MKGLLILCIVVFLTACQQKDEVLQIRTNIEQYYEALLVEDIEEVMKYIHPENENLYPFYENTESIFRQFNYSYSLNEIEVLEQTDTKAMLRVIVRTTGIEEETDEKQEFTLVYTYSMKKDVDGLWKILYEEVSPL